MENNISTQQQNENLLLNFFGSIPQAYDEYLGEFLFEPFAQNLVTCLDAKEHSKILELACGTGRLTKLLASHYPPSATILATDISTDMIAIARQKVAAKNVQWQLADIATLNFQEQSFDVIVCQFGFMFLQDKPAALAGIRKLLKPGAVLLFNVWGSPANNPVWQTAASLISRVVGPAPASLQATGPFSLSDEKMVLDLLLRAGFSQSVYSAVSLTGHSATAINAAKGFVYGLPFKDVISKSKPEAFPAILAGLYHEFSDKYGHQPLRTPLQAGVFKSTK